MRLSPKRSNALCRYTIFPEPSRTFAFDKQTEEKTRAPGRRISFAFPRPSLALPRSLTLSRPISPSLAILPLLSLPPSPNIGRFLGRHRGRDRARARACCSRGRRRLWRTRAPRKDTAHRHGPDTHGRTHDGTRTRRELLHLRSRRILPESGTRSCPAAAAMLTALPAEVQLALWLATWAVDPTGRTAAALRATAHSLAATTRDRFALQALAQLSPADARAFLEQHLQAPAPFAAGAAAGPCVAARPLTPERAAALWYIADTLTARLAAQLVPAAQDTSADVAWRTLACRYLQACARHGHRPLSAEDALRVRTGDGAWRFTPPAETPAATAARLLGADLAPLSVGVLWLAASYGNVEVVRWLLAAGADVHAFNELALRQAAALGNADVAEALLAAGAHVDVNAGEPLLRAINGGHEAVVRVLLAHGAATTTVRFSALAAATTRGSARLVALLLAERPAQMRAHLNEALCLATLLGDRELLNLLLAFAQLQDPARLLGAPPRSLPMASA